MTAAAAEPNDNRVPAGVLRDGVLTLRLVAVPAALYPEGPKGCALRVNAFTEEGAAPRVPGPPISVPVGTEVRVSIRNALPTTLRIHGRQDRTADTLDGFHIAPSATRELRFRATVPGSYYYWGADAEAVAVIEQPLPRRRHSRRCGLCHGGGTANPASSDPVQSPKIERFDDLPRHMYRVTTTAMLMEHDAAFAVLAEKLEGDLAASRSVPKGAPCDTL